MAVTKKKIGKGRHASCLKAQRKIKKRTLANKKSRTVLKNAIKSTRQNPNKENLVKTISTLAKSGRKNLIHPRKASRLISRLSKTVNRAKA